MAGRAAGGETRDAQLLQEAGVYTYTHPLESAVARRPQRTGGRSTLGDREAPVIGAVDLDPSGA